jgi:hypothetical protein
METRRTRAYWPTRMMLAFAIVSLPSVLWLVAMQPDMIGGPTASPGLDPGDVWMAVSAGLWFTGVIWMIRIFRGPNDDPPIWRYRDG